MWFAWYWEDSASVSLLLGIAFLELIGASMQLCLNVQLPEELGGLGGAETLYLDTEGSLSGKRIKEMAEAVLPSWSAIVGKICARY
jgi:hypothetical protein